MAARRLHLISSHLAHRYPSFESESIEEPSETAGGAKNPDDVVVVSSVRTAIGKAKRGSFKDTSPEKLLIPLIKNVLETTGLDPKLVSDFVVGTVLPRSSQGATEVRIASLLGGLPKEVPCYTVNRQCSSGLQAIANVASSIKAGLYDIGLAGGVESMSLNPMTFEGQLNEEALSHPDAAGCYMTMGQTSENVAERFGISRKEQDEFSVLSHQRAAAAQRAGKFRDEIVPVTIEVQDPKSGETKKVTISQDEGIRETTVEALGKLKAAFKPDGSTTAGNASQVSDGASVTLLARRSTAERLRLPVIGVLRSFVAVGVEPSVMGIGPAEAIPAAVAKAGLRLEDIDVYEINEAFASQATYCVKKLGLPLDKVNPNGGAIALGHPLGCTGSRLTATLLHELKRRGARYGVVSMCIGTGMGAAAVYEREA